MFHTISLDERFKSLESSGLRFLISGGAHCPSELIERFQNLGLTFKQGFGMTEVGPNCFLLEAKYSTSKMGSIGIPMPHSDVILLNDRDQQINQPNKIGELAIKGPHLCDGYFQNRQKFEESLIHGYFRTGDLAKFDEDGFYFIAGRKKDMFVSGGENIYPAEVERQIYSLNEVEDVVVVPVDDPKWGEVGFAFLKGEKKLPLQELREILNGRLSRYKHPHYVHYLEEMPLLANGKINRIQLKNLAQTLKEKEVRNDT